MIASVLHHSKSHRNHAMRRPIYMTATMTASEIEEMIKNAKPGNMTLVDGADLLARPWFSAVIDHRSPPYWENKR